MAMAFPVVLPFPVRIFNVPGGSPAFKHNSPNLRRLKDADSEGFKITELPDAKAGAIFQAPIINGKFQGTIAPTTPIGSR